VLRLGRYHTMRGPGLFWVVPFIDTSDRQWNKQERRFGLQWAPSSEGQKAEGKGQGAKG
jgi:regulator of protease activity HflC (stomatin/prohibitin superfamily)